MATKLAKSVARFIGAAFPRTLIVVAVVLVAVISPRAEAQNLVGNSGFELPGLPPSPGFIYLNGDNSTFMTGWTVTYDGVNEPSYVFRRTVYPNYIFEGDYSLQLNDGDSLVTTIATTPGVQYVWSFVAAGDDGGGQRLRAGDVDGVFHPARDGVGTGVFVGDSEWRRFAVVFIANTEQTAVSVADTPQGRPYQGLLLDAFRVVPCLDVLVPLSDRSTCPTGAASFGVAAAGSGSLAYQWQRETTPNSGNFVDLADGPTGSWDGGAPGVGAIISGSSTDTLTIAADTANGRSLAAPHAIRYRAAVTNACGSVESDPAQLTICAADITCDGTLTVQDFLAYLTAYSAGDLRADFTGDGAITVQDFLAFLSAFAAGCA